MNVLAIKKWRTTFAQSHLSERLNTEPLTRPRTGWASPPRILRLERVTMHSPSGSHLRFVLTAVLPTTRAGMPVGHHPLGVSEDHLSGTEPNDPLTAYLRWALPRRGVLAAVVQPPPRLRVSFQGEVYRSEIDSTPGVSHSQVATTSCVVWCHQVLSLVLWSYRSPSIHTPGTWICP